MSEKTIIITENEGAYQIDSSIVNEFELLGILEYIVFDLKSSRGGKEKRESISSVVITSKPESEIVSETPAVERAAQESPDRISPVQIPQPSPAASELRTRIGKAVKAIKDLGGQAKSSDLAKMTDEELQTELEELTAQYKRLKNSKK